MPTPRRRVMPRELFETRSHAWHSLGLEEELATPRFSKKSLLGLLGALLVLTATLVVYDNRRPGVSLEELDSDGVVLRVNATPLRAEDGSQLTDEVLAALREQNGAMANGSARG